MVIGILQIVEEESSLVKSIEEPHRPSRNGLRS